VFTSLAEADLACIDRLTDRQATEAGVDSHPA
jgi:hypothetical protein